MTALVPYTGDLLARSRLWTALPDDQLRQRAVEACRDHDAPRLWELTEAHLLHAGRRGARVSENTLRSYRTGVVQLVDVWKGESLLHPSRNAPSRWLRDLEARPLAPSTLRVRLAAARALYAALRWAGATEADPFCDVRPALDPTPAWEKRAPYSAEEIHALLDRADLETRVLLLLGAHAGLRNSEILGLTWSDVDLQLARMTILGKGGKRRRVVLSRSLIAALQTLGEQRGVYSAQGGPKPARLATIDAEPVVIGVRTGMGARKRIKRLAEAAGCAYRQIHPLRHAAGTRLYQQSGSLDAVSRHLGHSSVEVSRVYAKWADTTLQESVGQW